MGGKVFGTDADGGILVAMEEKPVWWVRVLLALPFAAFGGYTLYHAWTVRDFRSVDWWMYYFAGGVFVAVALPLLVPDLGHSPLADWLRELYLTGLLVLFLIPFNLWPFAADPGEGGFGILLVTIHGPVGRVLDRLVLVLAALFFDLFGVAQGVRLVRRTVRLLRGEMDDRRRRLP